MDILEQVLCTVWVQVIRQDGTPLLGGWNGKRTDTRKAICDDFFRLEHGDKALMLGMQTGIPVYLSKVKGESAVRFMLRQSQIGVGSIEF